MRYEEQAPDADLAHLIEAVWSFQLEEQDPPSVQHVVVPHGGSNLTLVEQDSTASPWLSIQGPGQRALSITVTKGTRYTGLRLQAGSLRALLGHTPPAAWFSEAPIPMALALPALAHAWREQLTGLADLSIFKQRVQDLLRAEPLLPLDALVAALVTQLNIGDEASITVQRCQEIVARWDLSERQTRRRFIAEVGLSPKAYARLRRVRRACVQLVQSKDTSLVEVSHNHGYADQSHFSREIKAVFGLAPGLLQRYLEQIQHL